MTVRAALIAALLYTTKVAMDPDNDNSSFSFPVEAQRATLLSLNLEDAGGHIAAYAFEIRHNGKVVCQMTLAEVVSVLMDEFPLKKDK